MSRHSYSELQKQNIAEDRIITDLPKAFRSAVTPYKSTDFNPKVREATSHVLGVKVVKAVLVGEVGSIKTRLLQRFCTGTFDRDYKATIGVDFEVEKFSVLSVPFTLQLWDTAGQERFKSIAASYYRSVNGTLPTDKHFTVNVSGVRTNNFNLNISNFDSLMKAKQWKEEACSNVDTENPLVFLVGSEKDLVSESVYENIECQASALANEIGAEYWAVSAKTGENVKALFFRIAALMFDAAVLRELQPANNNSKKIGNDLIRVQKKSTDGDDAWSRANNKTKCCIQ